MFAKYFWALLFLALGIAVMVVPETVFPVCSHKIQTASGGFIPMKCFWTARAELGAGGLIACGGFFLACFSSPRIRAGIALMLLPAGLLTMLVPTWLIGVCPGETMPCHMGTQPALCLLGGVTILAALILLLSLRGRIRRSAS